MYHAFIATLVGLAVLLGGLRDIGAQTINRLDSEVGPHGGKVLQTDGGKFEVKIDENNNVVDVYTLTAPDRKLTNQMKVKLSGSDQKREIYLKAVSPWRGLPHFQGDLPPSSVPHPSVHSQKAIAIELGWGR